MDHQVRILSSEIALVLARATEGRLNVSDVGVLLRALAAGDDQRVRAEGTERRIKALEETREKMTQWIASYKAAIGDGWHPLPCGGAVLVVKGEAKKLSDRGDSKRRRAIYEETEALLGRAGISNKPWSRKGVAEVEEIPF